MCNLKLTFEGETPSELHENISNYMAAVAGGATPVAAASGKTKGAAAAAKKELTLEELQEKFTKSGLTRPQKMALLSEFNCSTTSELEPKEYADFVAKMEELVAGK